MILIEIILESSETMFIGIPTKHHKELVDMYYRVINIIKNKPQFVKVSSFELIRIKFIQEGFNSFDVDELICDFTNYYYNLEKKEVEKTKFGFLEDLDELIWEYINQNKLTL
jgi:hypothetical protein